MGYLECDHAFGKRRVMLLANPEDLLISGEFPWQYFFGGLSDGFVAFALLYRTGMGHSTRTNAEGV